MTRPTWNQHFLRMAYEASRRSPDAETQHGAVLADANHRILGVGFNGFVRGADDERLPKTRPEKYAFMVHAEANCILNSQRLDDMSGCTLYVTGHPCVECAKLIAQAGIKRVVYGHVDSDSVSEADERFIQSELLNGIVEFERV